MVNVIGAQEAAVELTAYLGSLDPDTPARFLNALAEMAGVGNAHDPSEHLDRMFDVDVDEMVVVRGIDFVSLCEHHLLPFTGTAAVGYLPADGRVVGLSKIPRMVDGYARRLQVQERLTNQIADAMQNRLGPEGVGVLVRASHGCVACRGVRQPGVEMVTTAMRGSMRANADTRAEFLAAAR